MSHQYEALENTVYFWFAANDTSGSGDDGATPLFDVREAGAAASAIPLLSGTPTLLTHVNFPAGLHEIAVPATAANGFAEGDVFSVFATLAVDSQNPSGFVGSCKLTPHATSAQVDAIGTASGGAIPFAITADNTGGAIDPTSAAFVGSVQAGTFASLEAVDGLVHDIDDTGDDIDIVYKANVGGSRTAVQILLIANVDGNTDEIKVKALDFVGNDYEVIQTIDGSGGSSFVTLDPLLLLKHTGTGSELGNVYIRLETDSTTPSNLSVEHLIVFAVNIGQSVGYENGQIWVRTVGGTAGVEPFVNGVGDNPSLTWADALTLSTSTGLTDFHIINGSTIQLTASSDNFSLFGDNWILDLNGQSVADAYFQGAHVSGIGVSATEVHYEGCDVATMSVQLGHFDFCSFDATVTMTLAGDYNYHNCYSKVAGVGGPTFTKTAGQVITAQWRNWAGSITVSGIQASDVMTISGTELGDVVLNGAEGTVKILGIYESLTDNRTGSPTLVLGAFEGSDVTDILNDTGTSGVLLAATATSAQLVDDILDEVNTGATHNDVNSLGRQIRETRETNVYADNRIWIDTVGGAAGTTDYENGTQDNPVDNIADANTLATSLGKSRFKVLNGSSITFVAAQTSQNFAGDNWTLALGGQSIVGSKITGATVTGIASGVGTLQIFENCRMGAVSHVKDTHVNGCKLSGTQTLVEAGDIFFDQCSSAVAGMGSVTFDFGAALNSSNLNIRHHSGGWTIANMGAGTGTYEASFEGNGQIIWAASCSATSNASIRGNWKITDNAGGAVTETLDDNQTGVDAMPTTVFTTQMTESYAANGVAPTFAQAQFAIHQMLMQFGIAGTSLTVRKLDDATTAFIVTLDDATNPTDAKRV